MVETGSQYRDSVSHSVNWGHWFCFANILLAMAVASRYVAAVGWPPTALGNLYLLVSWVGHFGFLGFTLFLLLLFPLSFVLTAPRVLRIVAAMFATAALTLLLIDTEVFRQFKFHLTPQLWDMVISGSPGSGFSISAMFVVIPMIFLLELLLGYWIWVRLKKLNRRLPGSLISATFIVCFFLTHGIHIWADATLYQPITMQKSNFPLSYPMTAKSFLAKHGLLDLNEYQQEKAQLIPVKSQRPRYPRKPLNTIKPVSPPNILMVVISDLRFDMLSPQVMPNLWQFSESNWRLEHHFAGSNRTDFSLFSLYYGLTAAYLPTFQSYPQPALLDQRLKQLGYSYRLYSEDLQLSHILMRNPTSATQDKSYGNEPQQDSNQVNAFCQWHPSQATPWFSLVHLKSVAAYQIPVGFHERFQPTRLSLLQDSNSQKLNRQAIFNRYRNAAAYSDSLFATLLNSLEQSDELHNTIVIVTSDHGQEFDDTGFQQWGGATNFSVFQTQVPMVIHWPGSQSRVITATTSHADIAPTLLRNALGVHNPVEDYSTGADLLQLPARDYVLVSDASTIAAYSREQLLLVSKDGEVEVRNLDYSTRKNTPLPIPTILKVLNELSRFAGE